jgi:hypothetical protein
MADLTINPAQVRTAETWQQLTGPTDEVITKGQMVRVSATTGKFTKANGTTAAEGRAIGISIQDAKNAGDTITVIKKGIVDLGAALDAVAYDTTLKLSNTDGAIDDGAGSPTTTVNIGKVIAGWAVDPADKLLLVEL